MGKKKDIGIFCAILILQCLVIIIWGSQKVRLNVDEMFTMEGAKMGGVGNQYWDMTEDFYGNEHTNQEFSEHMTIYSDELLWKQGFFTVVKTLFQENFYYVIVNLASLIYPGHIPWSIGVGLNLLFFVLSQLVLYLLAKEFVNSVYALWTVALYGFSAGAISTVLYVRCYMLLTLYVLLMVYLYIRLMQSEKIKYKLVYFLSLGVLAVLCYRVHEFGTILFAVVTFFFLIYMLINKDKNTILCLIAGYGIPFLVLHDVIGYKLKIFFSAGVAPLFYKIAGQMTFLRLRNNAIYMAEILADHLFANIWIMILVLMLIMVLLIKAIIQKNKGWHERVASTWVSKVIKIIPLAVCSVYYVVLLIGGAVSWKYFSPGYPLIVFTLVIAAAYILSAGTPEMQHYFRLATGIVGVGCLVLSYNAEHISELYPEERQARNVLEEKYHGVNGIMVHHDMIGNGENWLYEAASLWPEESNVLVIQNKVLRERELCYNRDDNKILLWLTIDYNMDEALEWFKECTDYTSIDLVLNTEHLWIYECNKE